MVVGITRNTTNEKKFGNYTSWLSMIDPEIELVVLHHESKNSDRLNECDGLVLTGGGDVDPSMYGHPELIAETEEPLRARDEHDFRLLDIAEKKKMPVLGVCRGLQIANVYYCGSLHVDLEKQGYLRHRSVDGVDGVHDIHVSEDSLLKGIVRKATGQINSAHHQAVDRIGEGLHAVAHSPDNVIEGLEWEHPEGKPFLLLVQWHPERMTDRQSPFSYEIAKAFINSINGH